MRGYNWIAILLCVIIFLATFLTGDGSALMLNVIGISVVISGTFGATFLSYPHGDISAAFKVARNSYLVEPPTAKEIVNGLMDLSIRSRHEGILSLENAEEETTIMFLKSALGMLVDGYRPVEFRDVLYTEMYFFQQRRRQQERVFRHMARLAPSFGVAGSVIGLIGMLAGIGEVGVVIKTIPVALTSTLYGIVLANFVFIPAAESIAVKTRKELLMQKLVVEGVGTIASEHNTVRLQTKLESFLTPAARAENHQSFEDLRNKYQELKLARLEGAGDTA